MTRYLPTTIYSQTFKEKNQEIDIESKIDNILIREWKKLADNDIVADVLILDLDLTPDRSFVSLITDSGIYESFDDLERRIKLFLQNGGVAVILYTGEIDISKRTERWNRSSTRWIREIAPVRVRDFSITSEPELKSTSEGMEDIPKQKINRYLDLAVDEPEYYLSITEDDFEKDDMDLLAIADDEPVALSFTVHSLADRPGGHMMLLPCPPVWDVQPDELVERLVQIGNGYSAKEITFYETNESGESDADLNDRDQRRIEEAKSEVSKKGCDHDDTEAFVVQEYGGVSTPPISAEAGIGVIKVYCHDCHEYFRAEKIEDEDSGLLNFSLS